MSIQKRLKYKRRRSLQIDFYIFDGMLKYEPCGMERKAPGQPFILAAIKIIPRYRASQSLHMYPDLMGAARFQLQPQIKLLHRNR